MGEQKPWDKVWGFPADVWIKDVSPQAHLKLTHANYQRIFTVATCRVLARRKNGTRPEHTRSDSNSRHHSNLTLTFCSLPFSLGEGGLQKQTIYVNQRHNRRNIRCRHLQTARQASSFPR